MLPRRILEFAAVRLALAYHASQPKRREIVIENLLPPLGFDRPAAERKCRDLFRHFGLKLADLWRYEAGCALEPPLVHPAGWEEFEVVRARGRGVLLLTPHLGNWEFGAPFLRKRGVELQVITQAEPQGSLTRLRQASRARWGIDTLVIGENPFAFVEVIRRLEKGAAVALLLDRPPAATAVQTTLFEQPFAASIAASELARASGCGVLGACIPRVDHRYLIEMLPPIPADRERLGTRADRIAWTQALIQRFEPMIRKHLDQWYHFVPIWRPGGATRA